MLTSSALSPCICIYQHYSVLPSLSSVHATNLYQHLLAWSTTCTNLKNSSSDLVKFQHMYSVVLLILLLFLPLHVPTWLLSSGILYNVGMNALRCFYTGENMVQAYDIYCISSCSPFSLFVSHWLLLIHSIYLMLLAMTLCLSESIPSCLQFRCHTVHEKSI